MVSLRLILKLFLLLSLFIPFACKHKSEDIKERKPAKTSSSDSIRVLCLESFVSSGMSGAFVSDFIKQSTYKVSISTAANTEELIRIIEAKKLSFDVVLGLDNASAMVLQGSDLFTVIDTTPATESENEIESLGAKLFEDLNQETVNKDIDRKQRLIPYAYGYLGLLYNEALIPEPPESFGELQDPKYFNQMAICEPKASGIGKSILYWTVSLFGEEGYQHLWKSLRKNILRTYPSWEESFAALKDGNCAMIFGFSCTPNWYLESATEALPIKISMLKEGSFMYVENAAIPLNSENPEAAIKFIQFLLSPDVQQYVIYKLGLFPANTKTFLPMHFSTVPYSTFTVNSKLSILNVRSNYQTWLEFWDKLFSYRIVKTIGKHDRA